MINKFDDEYRWLSNFYVSPFAFGGRMVATVEHAYQASKAQSSKDFERIITLDTPGRAKRAGQKLKEQGLQRPDWDEVREAIMETLLRLKFEPGSELWWQLVNLDSSEPIVEGNNWHDTFWGVCDCGECPEGQNTLGKLLMKLRDEAQADVWDDIARSHEEWWEGGGR